MSRDFPGPLGRISSPPLLVLLLLMAVAAVARIYATLPGVRRRRIRNALRGRHVWITGGSQGLGFSLALAAFRAGARVTISSRSRHRLCDAAGAIHPSIRHVPLDVGAADPVEFRAAFARVVTARSQGHAHVVSGAHRDRSVDEEVYNHGPVDIVIANAGVNHGGKPFEMLDDAEIQAVLATNLLGVARTFSCALPGMLQCGDGVLCAVSSLAAYRGLPGASVYGASKAGVTALCQSLAVELIRTGVSVCCVHPGFVDTLAIADLKHAKPFQVSADLAAELILDAIARRASHAGFPWIMERILTPISMSLPSPMYEWILYLASNLRHNEFNRDKKTLSRIVSDAPSQILGMKRI